MEENNTEVHLTETLDETERIQVQEQWQLAQVFQTARLQLETQQTYPLPPPQKEEEPLSLPSGYQKVLTLPKEHHIDVNA